MAKIIISLLIPLLISCSILNRNARSSVSTMCVYLLSAMVAVDVPTPGNFNEGALVGFDADKYTPLGSEHTKKYSIYWGNSRKI